MEPIDEATSDLVDQDDVSKSEHANESTECIEDVSEENIQQIADQVEPISIRRNI